MSLTHEQVVSVLKSFGISEKSIKFLEESGHAFPRASKKDQDAINRDTQRFPHFSPGAGETPPHITSIRLIKQLGGYDIIQRFHQHISVKKGAVTLTEPLHDRFRAIKRDDGAIFGATCTRRVDALSIKTIGELRSYDYTVGRQVTERQQNAVMSKAVRNRFHLGPV